MERPRALKAGERDLTVAFLKMTSALDEATRLPFMRPYPAGVNIPETRMGAHLRSVEIAGPYKPAVPNDSRSRRRIFVCHPKTSAEEPGCARRIVSTLARRAYRRPVADADITPLLAMYDEGRPPGGFDAGIERALKRLLVSPEFLFRVERDPANAAPEQRLPHQRSGARLAAVVLPVEQHSGRRAPRRWRRRAGSRTPRCSTQTGAADARRSRARKPSSKNFAGQWLYLRNLQTRRAGRELFPDFDDSLRQAMRRETELFFDSVVREDRGALDLLSANYTFLNERLAQHYGIPNVKGSHFRRVTFGRDSPPRRSARAGQHPDRDLAPGPHLAGRARQVDSREHPRHLAAAAAAERARAEADRRAGSGALDARPDGAASREPGVRELSRDHGSARPRARELRRRRQSRVRSASRRPRSTRRACCRTARSSSGPAGLKRRC